MDLPFPEDSGAETAEDDSLSISNDSILVDAIASGYSDSDDDLQDGMVREFDTNIPTLHKYLGRLDSISGYSIFDHGEHLTVVALHTNTIVSPGFTLPLILDRPIEQEIMKKCIDDKCVFAVVFQNESRSYVFPYGIIMEVYESFVKSGTMYLKAKGRQRCKILCNQELQLLGGRLAQNLITVRALAEPDIESPICCTQLLHLKASQPYSCKDYDHSEDISKNRRYHLAQFPYASWVYNRNEVRYHCKLVIDKLKKFHMKDCIPTDPVLLSYWFLQNFQLSHDERLEMLRQYSVLERLKLAYEYLLMERIICCRVCRQSLAEHKDVFPMSKDGVQSAYCNPGGHVYETVTVTKIRNCTIVGFPSKEFSWFPGYEWTILQCQTCRNHIGWRFTSKHLQPTSFFGLARANLDIKIINQTHE